jgi:hypothetical protein
MAEQYNQDNKDLIPKAPQIRPREEFDAAGKSLSEALGISFIILKVIMVVLVIIFLASGLRTVGSNEQALVLRFGKIRGIGENRVLGPGLKLLFPYPIHEIVKIPTAKKQPSQSTLSGTSRKTWTCSRKAPKPEKDSAIP